MDTGTVTTVVNEIKTTADTILATIESFVPGVAGEAAIAQGIVDLAGVMVGKALAAWSTASGQPITAETIAALLPNATPLTPPTA